MEIRIDKTLQEFIESLEKPTIARTLRAIDLLETFGHRLGMPHSKKITPGLFELRIRGTQEIRIFYTFYKQKIVLLHGIIKKSNKIPSREIEIAIKKLDALDMV